MCCWLLSVHVVVAETDILPEPHAFSLNFLKWRHTVSPQNLYFAIPAITPAGSDY